MGFYVRVKYKGETRSIKLNSKIKIRMVNPNGEAEIISKKTKLTMEDVICKAMEAFGISSSEEMDVSIYDQHKMQLDESNIQIIKQNRHCSNLCLELIVYGNEVCIENDQLKTSIESYLMKNDESIITEYNRCKKFKKSTMKKLLGHLAEFIFIYFGSRASLNDISSVSQAAAELFELPGGKESLFDENSKRGKLYNVFRYQRSKIIANNKPKQLTALSTDEKKEINTFFQSVVLPVNKKTLKEKMIQYKDYRRDIIINDFEGYKRIWEFYFICPDLLSFDYDVMFGSDNSNKLLECWSTMQTIPATFNMFVDKAMYPIATKDEALASFMAYMKWLPTPRVSFDNALKAILQHSMDPGTDVMEIVTSLESKSEYPYLVAIASSVKDECKYFVVIENRPVTFPIGTPFVTVLDVYYKAHKIFNLDFNPKVKSFIQFLDTYIFGVADDESKNKISPKMREIAEQIYQIIFEN